MGNSNKKKSEQLGIPHGTATHRLRKMIMFELVKQVHKDICCRCGQRIESLDAFSVEHIEPWLDSDDPVGKFFDLDNIAFSHIKCNISAARRVGRHDAHFGRRTTARLNRQQVSEVKTLLRDGKLSQRAISRKFGVHHKSIQCIADGRSWCDVE